MAGQVVRISSTWGARSPMPAAEGTPCDPPSVISLPPATATRPDLDYAFLGWRLPSTSLSQVPLGTYTQASPCLLALDVPAQEEFAV
jgi:hypothetical protein